MKKIVLTALAVAALQLAQAQQNQNTPAPSYAPVQKHVLTPEQAANRQTAHLQKVLTLSEEQKLKIYQASLTRNTALKQLKEKDAENKKAMRIEAKPIKEQFVKDVNATLTPEQQKKWEQIRLEEKQKRQEHRNQQAAPANGVKLEPHDDGVKD